MTERQFAQGNGFADYESMLIASEIVIKDASTWLVTPTQNGFLAWSTSSLEKPLGYFDTFEMAKQEILDAMALAPSL